MNSFFFLNNGQLAANPLFSQFNLHTKSEFNDLFRKPPVHDIKNRCKKCLWCLYGCQRCISQPFSFISLPVSTVNALVNEKIRYFKAAFDLWCVQCNKIKSGVIWNFVLSKCLSVRLPRCFEKHPARHEWNMQRKKKTSINDCRLRFRSWKTNHSANDFSQNFLKCTQKLHIYSWGIETCEFCTLIKC